jgi:RNA polymerase sigma factor (sigma-70 family)
VDEPTQVFVEHRELLFACVYNILGSVADTEDVLQETWLAWAARNRNQEAEPVENTRAYLVRVAVHQALARRAAISRRRETYVGEWLPEPLVGPAYSDGDAAEAADRVESFSMALLVVLESLTPLERAVFVLHEVFGFSFPEIASAVGRSEDAGRQLAVRARRHMDAGRPRFEADRREREELAERFFEAFRKGTSTGCANSSPPTWAW